MGIGPRGWGRQGSAVALRLDSADGVDEAGVLLLGGTQLGDFLTSMMKQKGLTVVELALATGIIEPKEPESNPLLRHGPRARRTHLLESILDGWTDRPSDAQLTALGKALDVPLEDLMKLIPEDLQRLDGGENLNPQQASKSMDTIDINLDGRSNISDATAFGTEFGGGKDPSRVDVNGDGTINDTMGKVRTRVMAKSEELLTDSGEGLKVKITLKDGRVFEHVTARADVLGSQKNPWGFDAIKEKFQENVSRVLSADGAAKAIETWENIPEMTDIATAIRSTLVAEKS
ncbi:MAG: hypothetical protein IIB89_05720 [Chloroflexi bacterium]|nr:hypothetical protein [Chloroflexota bacterium]